jgi:hypothetical protein
MTAKKPALRGIGMRLRIGRVIIVRTPRAPMRLEVFVAITVFIFLAIVGGLVGIVLEGRRIPPGTGTHNPATRDTVFPIVGWASLFALYLALEFVADDEMTLELKTQLATVATLLFCYAALATAWLIWRSARRIHASLTYRLPVAWRPVPFLRALRFPILLVAAAASAAIEFSVGGFTLTDLMFASIVVLLALIRKPAAPSSNQ